MLDVIRQPFSRLAPNTALPRHLHTRAYATLVLEGGYEEAGDSGRWRTEPGHVLIHAPFSIHRNTSLVRGARLMNLPLASTTTLSGCGATTDADLVIRLARHDPASAAEALVGSWRPATPPLCDAPDRLAQMLSSPRALSMGAWSEAQGQTRQTVFRGFRRLYGVAPTRFRVEARARLAWRLIVRGGSVLAEVALEAGYADQAHMSRDVKALTGGTPGAWAKAARMHHSFKAEAALR